ncbi:NADH-dependent flavin oxidoreductase [Saccharibacillus endophyticus]|uniref:NADH-dependent flavin oxidoreductase YqiG n=1 Tax=Saccharibacillus endophyticus TaxID=2060666 RepID=A0ABQ1ZUT7_9BACL|nr:NADH-dependent flavin oxidoreductase [Saccharibacillus endophyticus]GGH78559.1 putative NADH-dependent flavin oxidoreductase YqiG [Saccharibacillus endophyticus]
MNPIFNPLFQPFTFRSGLQIPNRIVMAPMTNWSSHPDGSVSEEELRYYERRSGQVGLVITACVYVTPNGKGFHGEFAADRDDMIPSLQRLASAIQGRGTKAILQLYHGGRECPAELVPEGDVVSAGNVPNAQNPSVIPRPLTHTEIVSIVKDFGEATRRAIEAGYDGIEIHGANGYLFQQFFSPHTNNRDDQWGGSLTKRMAFPLAVVDEVIRVVDEHGKENFAVGYRFSPEEAESPGITMPDTLELIEALAQRELDYLHISLMDYSSHPRSGKERNRSRMAVILDKLDGRVPLIGVGAIRTAEDALNAYEIGVPLVALGRQLIVDPDWVKKVQEGKESDIVLTLTKDDQESLVIPAPMWKTIMNSTPGWFPIV